MLNQDVNRDEIVKIALMVGCFQFSKGTKTVNVHDGHDTLQNAFQSDDSQRVRVDDGYMWSGGVMIGSVVYSLYHDAKKKKTGEVGQSR